MEYLGHSMNTQFNTVHKIRKIVVRILIYTFLIAIALSAFFPFYTMIISSTHDNFNITARVNLLPGGQFIINYKRLTANLNIWRGFLNSLIISCCVTVIELYFVALAGYTFAKFRFKGRNTLFSIVLVAMMIPGQVGVIGFFKQMSDIHLLNSYIPLIVPSVANCFGVFFFKQYLDGSLPDEILEAAYIDGCKELTSYHRIVLPIMAPALVTQGVMTFIGSWNSYMNPLIILRETSKMTLPVLIASIKSKQGSSADYGAQYVGILLSVVPLVIIFSLSSKLIMDKISIGSVIKG
jgi:multiple sugar transport system permease protein